MVALLVSAWIEINQMQKWSERLSVALLVSAWIEIGYVETQNCNVTSHSS